MSYISLLRSNKTVMQLTGIQVVAYFGSWFSHVAIFSILIHFKASPLLIAAASIAMFLPTILLAPISGSIVDRSDPKKLMSILLIVETICTFALLAVNSASMVWLLLLLVFLRMGSAGFYFTAEMALLPKLLHGLELKKANELHSIIWSLTYTLGMALGGIAVEFMGVKTAIIVDGILLCVATLVFLTVNIKVVSGVKENILSSMQGGLAYIKENPKLLGWMGLHAMIGFTAYDSLVALLANNYYKETLAVALAIGYINASRALALVIGPWFFGFLANYRGLTVLFLLQGVAIEFWALVSHNFWLSLIGTFTVGLFTTTLWSFTITALQESTKPQFLGRVLAYNDLLFMTVAVISSGLIGGLAQAGLPLPSILSILGSTFLISGFVYFMARRKSSTPSGVS